jgi:AcrR family transcriptional regulator
MDPGSMKAKVLAVSRQIFGEQGYYRGTISMIAKVVGIDISTIHYYWGETKDLYEAVLLDVGRDVAKKLAEVETSMHGLPLNKRFSIFIYSITDYLFEHREISSIILFCHSRKNPQEVEISSNILEITSHILRLLFPESAKNSISVSPCLMMHELLVMNSINNFVVGEDFV